MVAIVNQRLLDARPCYRRIVPRAWCLRFRDTWLMTGSREHDQLKSAQRIDVVCDRFEQAWRANESPRIEDYLLEVPEADRSQLLNELLANEIELRTGADDAPTESEFLRRFPDHADAVHQLFADSRTAEFFEQLREYQFEHKLGQGGMGEVYKAAHTKLKRPVAIKILPAEKMHNPQTVARFHREMEAVGRLDDPHIVRAYDAGEANGTHYLVMEFVDGFDLQELQSRIGRLPIADSCEIIRQAASGLQSASELGLVHRDIKPSNLMLTRSGLVKILDLGLAQTDGPASSRELTTTGQVMGTCDYIAPEQATDTKSVDIRADIYSLGCTLFKLLVGRAPYVTDSHQSVFERIRAHLEAPIPSVSAERDDVPAELDALQTQLLAKQPQDRVQTPAELVTAIEPMCADHDLVRLHSQAVSARSATADTASNLQDSTVNPLSSALTETQLEQQIVLSEVGGDLQEQPTVNAGPQKTAGRSGVFKVLASLLLIAGLVYGATVVLRFKAEGGTIVLECDPAALEDAKIEVDGKEVKVTLDGSGKPISIAVDQKRGKLRITKDGFKVFAKDFAIASVDGEHTIQVHLDRLEVAVRHPISNANKLERNPPKIAPEVEVNVPELLPPLDKNTTREAAEWALSAGASISLHVPSSKTSASYQPGQTIRVDEFLLESVRFSSMNGERHRLVTDDVLDNLRGVKARRLRLTFQNTDLSQEAIFKLLSFPEIREDLVDLTVSGAQWTNESVFAAAAFPNLERLAFEGCSKIDDAAISHLRTDVQSTSLGYLDLSGSSITDDGLKQLAEMERLRGISLAGCKNITAEGLRELLSKPSSITSLDISQTGLGDEVLGDIAKAGIEHLRVNGNPITYEGVKQLNNIALHHFYAEGTGLGDNAVSYLSRLRLEYLVLTDTEISDESVEDLGSVRTLQYLYIGGTRLTLNGLNAIKGQLPDCWISVGNRTREIVEWIQSVDGKAGVFPMTGGSQTSIRKDSKIPGFPFRLSDIELGSRDPEIGKSINDGALDSLIGLSRQHRDWVRTFKFLNTSLSNKGIANISTLPGTSNVEDVTLVGINSREGLEDAILTMAKRWRSLEEVNLEGVQLSGDAVSRLRTELPNCEINVESKSRTTMEWIESVGGKATISFTQSDGAPPVEKVVTSQADLPDAPFVVTDVDLANVSADAKARVTDYAPIELRQLPIALDSLALGGPKANKKCLERLESSTLQSRVGKLILHGDAIDADVVTVVARLPQLKALAFVNCGQMDDAAFESLKTSELTSVKIEKCPKITAAGIEKLKSALHGCEVEWDRE